MEPGQEQQLAVLATLERRLRARRHRRRPVRHLERRRGDRAVRGAGQDGRPGRGQHHGPLPGPCRDGPAHRPLRPRASRSSFPPQNIIDVKAAAKWRELGLVPSAVCSDAEFLRRAMLDTIGTTPTPDEVEDFLADADPDKRTKLVDRLLDRPEYVDYWTLKWGDLLRVNSDKLGAQGMLAFNLWLREAFRANMPVNRMVDELVTAQGSIFSNGPANYFRVASSPDDLAETTAQVFMGVRLQCAKCHHHPFEAYGQDDYYGLAAYFARVQDQAQRRVRPLRRRAGGLRRQDGRGLSSRGPARRWPRGRSGGAPVDDPVDRRRALASWLTSREPALAGPQRRQPLLGLPDGQGAGQPDRRPARDQSPVQPRAARRPGRMRSSRRATTSRPCSA